MAFSVLWFPFLIVTGLLVHLSWRCRNLQGLVDRSSKQVHKLSAVLPYLEEMPLFKEGRDIQYRWNCIEEEWEIIKASFFRQEWDELKAFMATRPLPDQPFVPSEGLMRSLERWAEKNAVYWEMDRRRDEYKQAFADVMAGKLSVKEAGRRTRPDRPCAG
jgi:hypothetical protein